jgi:hypothetical protein
VTRVKVGDRIAGTFHPRWFGGPIRPEYLTDRLGANLDGMLAEYAVLNEEALVQVPNHLSFEEAATLPCAAVTAWVALTGHRQVGAGGTVLTQANETAAVDASWPDYPTFNHLQFRFLAVKPVPEREVFYGLTAFGSKAAGCSVVVMKRV